MKNHILLLLLALSACSAETTAGIQNMTASSPARTHLNYTVEQKNLLAQAEKGNVDAQYFLAQSLFETADLTRIKESDFYHWMKKAADNGHEVAQDVLADTEADAMTSQEAEDWFAPNGTQKIMDEIRLLAQQTPIDYRKIREKLQQAATLQNYMALSHLTVIYGTAENATVYGVKTNPLTACTLALYNNHLYGDVNKGHLDVYCNGEKVTNSQFKQAEQFSEMLIKHPNRLSELW
ncbi:sel1 repeat family protein [Wielerella bovis]|uniref:sel1 repeat family protein n=1 Tax=Wielerella bovis TaxID=2917790 RepID=UPI002019684E|nr:sel1 repeat family protein [Wielerella bovis]ULJ60217.1 sel1 repeat family protein [Wielerella bovis]